MHELTGRLNYNISFTAQGNPIITLELNERNPALKMVEELHGADKLSIKLDKYRQKRSLNANNYAWKLITEMGNKLHESKEDIYFKMLKDYGQSEMISVLAHIPLGGYIKYFEEAGESNLNGKLFKHYRVYKGSSEFDTKEMSIFIDGIVTEAQNLGIPTDTPDQIAKMKALWGE